MVVVCAGHATPLPPIFCPCRHRLFFLGKPLPPPPTFRLIQWRRWIICIAWRSQIYAPGAVTSVSDWQGYMFPGGLYHCWDCCCKSGQKWRVGTKCRQLIGFYCSEMLPGIVGTMQNIMRLNLLLADSTNNVQFMLHICNTFSFSCVMYVLCQQQFNEVKLK